MVRLARGHGAERSAVRLSGTTLVVTGRCGAGHGFGPCHVDVTLGLPAGIPVNVRIGGGSLDVDGPIGRLFARVGTGSVTARHLGTAPVDVRLSAGDAVVSASGAPPTVAVEVGVGRAEVRVPAGVGPWLVDAEAAVGNLRVEGLATDPQAPRTIRVRVAVGDAVVLPS